MDGTLDALVVGLPSYLASGAGCAFAVGLVRIAGSGSIVSEEKEIAGFDEVDVSHAFAVQINQADGFRVVVHTDDNLREYVRVVKRGRALALGLARGARYDIASATLRAEVTLPALVGVRLSGASRANIGGFDSPDPMEVIVSGASRLRGDIEAGDTHLRLSGASQVTLAGSGKDLAIEASGASHCHLTAFPVEDAQVTLSGASGARVELAGRLWGRLSGASSVVYAGSPTAIEAATSGVSSVKPE